jgi:Flp pilus assembly protein TadD
VAKGDFSSAIVSLQQLIQQQPKMPEAKLLLADTYKLQGDLDSAAKLYRKLEQEFPDNAQTPVLLGMILMQQQKRQEARQEFTHALELAPDYLSALEQLTTLDLDEGHFTAALERVQREMEKNPKDPEPSILLAKIYVSQKNVPQAVTSLQKTIELHPDFLEGSFTLAEVYADSGQDQKALDIMHGLLAKHPDQIGTWMLLGMIEDKLKDYKAARDAYEKVLSLDPKKSVALNNLAYLYSEHNDLDKGYELARRARVLLPYDSSTADTLGWILYKKGDFNQAAGLLDESATQQPDEPDIQLHLGLTLYMMGDEDGSRVALQKALQAKTLLSGADVAQQRMTILMVDPKTATPEVRAALEKQVGTLPNDSIALSRLAAIYKRDGATDKAITAEEAAMKANPKNARVVLDLAQLYSMQPGQTGKALELAKSAYKLAPADSGTARTLGHLSLLSGDYKFSQNLLLQAARQSPGDPELLYDLAQATYSQGQVADAESEMRTALQGGASFTHAAEAKHFLDMVALSSSAQSAVAATAQVQQNLNSDANYVPALMAMGGINEQKPDAAAAIQNYEKVLDRYPDFAPAKRRLAVLYAAQPAGDNGKAYAVASKAYQAYPDDADVSRALGIILYRQGEFAKSSQRLKDITAKKTGDAQAMYYLGMDQYQLKQTAESKKNLQRAMELKLPNDQASEAQRVLALLK